MADWAVSTNFISWSPVRTGMFGWPTDGLEAEAIRRMAPGDRIVPKFAQHPSFGDQDAYQRAVSAAVRRDFDADRADYTDVVAGGAGAVPFVMIVQEQLGDLSEFPAPYPWACVAVEVIELDHPISTSEFLRLRPIPIELAGQFKAMAAPNRHIQKLPPGAGVEIMELGSRPRRTREDLRQQLLVRAADADEAVERLGATGWSLLRGDRAFLALPDRIPGLFGVDRVGRFVAQGEPIEVKPEELRRLFESAHDRAVTPGEFRPARALNAADELADFILSGDATREISEFGHFHDRYVLLPRKVTEALALVARPDRPARIPPPEDEVDAGLEGTDENDSLEVEYDDVERLKGLTVTAARRALPEGVSFPDSVLAEAVTALRTGKHLLLSGPPGTGKSTLATGLCRAVVESRFHVATATAGWTGFDTIGGYMPDDQGGLRFEPGIVLRSLKDGSWLVIDEVNRADIDKAFGPLFTLLAGGGPESLGVVLPYRVDRRPIEIAWDERLSERPERYAITPSWRLIGTMNAADKASLFQLSFAFLRRFAVIDVPLPDREPYAALIRDAVPNVSETETERIVQAAMDLAFGAVPLGPAILLDVAKFTDGGLLRPSGGEAPYADAASAFLTAVRLYVVPQYEGATREDAERLVAILGEAWPDAPARPMEQLRAALDTMPLA